MSKVAKGISRAFGGNKVLAAVIGVVAAVVIPFAAPVIAGALAMSGVVGSTLVGAAMGAGFGALSGSLTGDLGRGMLLGGLGGAAGGFMGGGGMDALFGSGAAAGGAAGGAAAADPLAAGYQGAEAFGSAAGYQGATGPATAAVGATTAPTAAAGTGVGSAVAPGATQAATGAAPQAAATGIGSGVSAAPTAATTAAPTAATTAAQQAGGAALSAVKPEPASWGSRVVTGFLGPGASKVGGAAATPSIFTAEGLGAAARSAGSALLSPSGAQLAMAMFNKPEEGLTTEERAMLAEAQQAYGVDRALFDERVAAARRLTAQGQANPEQAYAQAQIGMNRRTSEAGLRTDAERRRSAIEGSRLGTLAASAEQARAAQSTASGLNAMPTTVPRGTAGLSLAIARDRERQQQQYESDLARAGGGLFTSRTSLFS